jgi:Tannase and feruloyl esterase
LGSRSSYGRLFAACRTKGRRSCAILIRGRFPGSQLALRRRLIDQACHPSSAQLGNENELLMLDKLRRSRGHRRYLSERHGVVTAPKHAGEMDRARDFARLFLIPGMDHCGVFTNGPGIADTGVDMLGALEEWVEKGKAPDEVLATKTDGGGATLWQRPVCAWPQIATFKSGNPKVTTSYACMTP